MVMVGVTVVFFNMALHAAMNVTFNSIGNLRKITVRYGDAYGTISIEKLFITPLQLFKYSKI